MTRGVTILSILLLLFAAVLYLTIAKAVYTIPINGHENGELLTAYLRREPLKVNQTLVS